LTESLGDCFDVRKLAIEGVEALVDDPDGTRAPGATQADMLKSHQHQQTRFSGGAALASIL
jgi:hypothetical protein